MWAGAASTVRYCPQMVGDIIPVVGFPSLCEGMFRTGCELARESQAATGVDQMRRTIACIVMCQAALEAFLNESVERVRSVDASKPANEREWGMIVEALSGASLEMRWLVYPRLRWGRTFDRSCEPFQSFHLLVNLRNELAHYDPTAAEHAAFPNGKIRSLDSRFDFIGPKNSSWTIRVLNAACARWACRSAKAMIQEYCHIAGSTDPWSPAPGINASTGAPFTALPHWCEPPDQRDSS